MNIVLTTKYFDTWLSSLKDNIARIKIIRRIERAEVGNFGDHKNVSGPIWEMRLDYGPGYHIYYGRKEDTVYIIVCGGDKDSQQKDINLSKEIWSELDG